MQAGRKKPEQGQAAGRAGPAAHAGGHSGKDAHYYRLEFSLEAPRGEHDTLYVAQSYPYTYTRLQVTCQPSLRPR